MYYIKKKLHNKDGGRAYFDKDTGYLCLDLTRQDYPTNQDILVPYVCTTCGEVSWKAKSNIEKDS